MAKDPYLTDEHIPAEGLPDPPGMVREPGVRDLPKGYRYSVTRYADLILRDAFPERYQDLYDVLSEFRIEVHELLKGGGSRVTMTARFDSLLNARG